ncbi:hypothetical protein BU15DRAFT_59507 [Melanogaster broomeanus]|nr:hypothetical protein BU15DRAFT_59507 [Melanogaster broomeanus]
MHSSYSDLFYSNVHREPNDTSVYPVDTPTGNVDVFHTFAPLPVIWGGVLHSAGTCQESDSMWTDLYSLPSGVPDTTDSECLPWNAQFPRLIGETSFDPLALTDRHPPPSLPGVGITQNNENDPTFARWTTHALVTSDVAAPYGNGIHSNPSVHQRLPHHTIYQHETQMSNEWDLLASDAGEGPQTYICRWSSGGASCDTLVLGDKRDVMMHLHEMHSLRPKSDKMAQRCLWDNCRKAMNQESIPRHIVTVHMRERVHCPSCRLTFARSDSLQRHGKRSVGYLAIKSIYCPSAK